jgi:hypothetical protein
MQLAQIMEQPTERVAAMLEDIWLRGRPLTTGSTASNGSSTTSRAGARSEGVRHSANAA